MVDSLAMVELPTTMTEPSGMSLKLGDHQPQVDETLAYRADEQLVSSLWEKDYTLWRSEPTEIDNRLGWLTVAEQMQERIRALRSFAKSVFDDGFRFIVLLGVDGSSLGPEVLSRTFGPARGLPRLIVLDSTVPAAVRAVTNAIDPARMLFVVASKSGETIEVTSLFSYFWDMVARVPRGTGGKQFVAITDPDTSLLASAQERGFRAMFTDLPNIGGRCSVLWYFGLVPAALIGMDVDTLLLRASEMVHACVRKVLPKENPGGYLGAAMGLLERRGKDKVTIIASPKIESFGLWTEQLLAESTGKSTGKGGRGLISIVGEPFVRSGSYNRDRMFVYLRMDQDANGKADRHTAALERAGHLVIRVRLRDRYDLGAEFFRWEFATAVASHVLSVHPFDQPNVHESKENTKRILEEVRRSDQWPRTEENGWLRDLLSRAKPGNYLAVLAYVPPSTRADAALNAFRKAVLNRYGLITTTGYGPRYLHSTGQLHKGGPNTGLFLELIERTVTDIQIRGAPYTFGTLARAQTVGDWHSLKAHGRSVVRLGQGHHGLSTIKTLAAGTAGMRGRKALQPVGGSR